MTRNARGYARRHVIRVGAGALATLILRPAAPMAADRTESERAEAEQRFLAQAQRMKALAISSGDQAYGAVLVLDGQIVGWGPSRVVVDADPAAHAERVALWDAQQRLGRKDLSGAIVYGTSPACAACRSALAKAGVSRMVHTR